MLGHFLALGAFRSLRPRYPALRRRINAFLAEAGVPVRLPARAKDYQVDAFVRMLAVLEALRDRSGECASTAWLSAAVILRARGVTAFRAADLAEAARALGIDRGQVLRYAKAVPRAGGVTISNLLDPAMRFLQELIGQLRPEPRTCFVAMPFRRPFERYYDVFYRPALRDLGYRAIRAWGGVGMEDYLEVILALLSRCGACLADVTGLNPNVLYELGAAQGMDKRVMILAAKTAGRPPANVSQHTAFRFHYNPGARGWPDAEVHRFVGQTAFAEFAMAVSPE